MINNFNELKKHAPDPEKEKKITAKETDVNFDYIPRLRYIVEIKDQTTKKRYFSIRICSSTTAEDMKNKFNGLWGLESRVHDTKTGEVI